MTWPPRRDIIAPVNEAEKAAVRQAQRLLRLVPTGDMDEPTKACLRGVQRLAQLPVSGVLDRATAQALQRLAWIPPED
jgi:hypothetical protein